MGSNFSKVATEVDFSALERSILDFWQRTNAFERRREKNRGKPTWSFLDGPITANNPMGVHHAWGRTYKDTYSRYFAMTGHELRYQNGFDCQGLWVEVEVEKELGLRSKQDIENLVLDNRFASIDRFVALSKERVNKFARIQTAQSIRLGYWMDWDRDEDWLKPTDERRSYFTMSEENNYTIWSFLKKCHERGLVYRAYDSMPWCPRCAVGLSQMEMHEGYQFVAHRAVFVRFPLRGRPGENLLIWTTTPWTLTSNVAAAVNPNLTYVKVKHRDQIYYLAKGAFIANRKEEEFLLGKEHRLVPIAPLDEEGVFLNGLGALEGKSALDEATTDWILSNLQEKGVLFAVEKYPHSYPHCWRCKTELLFRLVDEWVINMGPPRTEEGYRGEIMRIVEDVTFLPESINGRARERDWLWNMGDWMISKKRFWGLALPIWVCEKCGQFEVIARREDLKQRAVAGWDKFDGHSPHRPWIDLVKIRCDKCGGTANRIADV